MDDGRAVLREEIATATSGRFDAFISYSHRADDDIAPSIRNGLQRLAKPWYRRRAMRVFLDRTNMSADPALWTAITRALDTSKGFVLLMSPESAKSPWVNREIEYWVERNGSDRILPVLTSGELFWDGDAGRFDETRSTAAPPALAGVYHEEPRYIDLRWADGQPAQALTLRDPRFADAMAEIAAPIREVNKDELVGADLREHRKTLLIARSGVAVLCVLLVAAVVSAVIARSNASRAERRRIDAQASRLRAEAGDSTFAPDLGFLLAAEAYRLRPGVSTIDGVIKAAQRAPDLRRYVRLHSNAIVGLAFDDADETLVSYDQSGVLTSINWSDGKVLATAKAEGRGAAVVSTPRGVLVVGLSKAELRDPKTLNVLSTWVSGGINPFAGAVMRSGELAFVRLDGSIARATLPSTVAAAGSAPTELAWSKVHDNAAYGGVGLADGSYITIGVSGAANELVRFTIAESGAVTVAWRKKLQVPVSNIAVSADSTRVVLGFGRGALIYDTSTGEGITGSLLDSAVNALASSSSSPDYVLAANQDGKIDYVDLASGSPFKEQIHEGRATAIAWGRTGRAASGDGDGTIALLDTGPNRYTGGRSIDLAAAGVAVRSTGRGAVAALTDGSLVELNIDLASKNPRITKRELGRVSKPTTVAESSGLIVVGDEAGLIHALRPGAKTVKADTGTASPVTALSALEEGVVVSRTVGLVLQTWKVEATGVKLIRTLSDRASSHSAVTDPSGVPVVAYFESDSGVVVADASTGEELQRYPLDSPSAQIALAPDGRSIAVSNGSDVRLLSPGGKERNVRVGGDVSGLVFVDGGARLVSFDSASGARVIDVATGQSVGFMRDEDGPPLHAYSAGPMGELVAIASAGTPRVVLMSFTPANVIGDGCSFFGRPFTPAEQQRFDLDSSANPCVEVGR